MKLETLEDGIVHLEYLINHPKKDNSYVIVPETIVNYVDRFECDLDYCEKNNIKVTQLSRKGSTFVFNKGDLVFLHCGENDHFGIKWRQYLKNKLISKGLNAFLDNNDLLIDGYKSLGDTELKSIYICCIAIKNNPELIENICLKPINKIPRGLEYYNISTEEVEKWYLDFIFYFK